jgi:hypothetical protein
MEQEATEALHTPAPLPDSPPEAESRPGEAPREGQDGSAMKGLFVAVLLALFFWAFFALSVWEILRRER